MNGDLVEAVREPVCCDFKVVLALLSHPETRGVSNESGQQQCCLGAYGSFPWAMAWIRLGSTLMAFANRYWVSFMGPKDSSLRISPGCIGVSVVAVVIVPPSVLAHDSTR